MTNPATASFRERIAAKKSALAAAAPVAAAVALAGIANTASAAVYTVSPTSSYYQSSFDPLDGSYDNTAGEPTYGYYTAANPIMIESCGGAVASVHSSIAANVDFVGTSAYSLSLLPVGTLIDATSTFGATNDYTFSDYVEGSHFLGFRFVNQGVGGDETYFGWAEFTIDDFMSLTLTRFAIGGNGESIVTGQDATPAIPEPASAAALFGTLALGAVALRRRRSA